MCFIPIRDLFFEKTSPGYAKLKSMLFCSSMKLFGSKYVNATIFTAGLLKQL